MDTHGDLHSHHDVEVVESRYGMGSGPAVTIALLIVLLIIGLAVVWTHPWGSSGTHTGNPNPGISDNSGGSGGGSQSGGGSGGTDSGGGQSSQ